MAPLHPLRLAARAQRAYQRLQSEGLGLLEDKYVQRRLKAEWAALASATHWFKDKVGLEVGGPSGIFRAGSPIPAYRLSERVDNCNFSGDTAWVQNQRAGATFAFDPPKPPGQQYFCEAGALTHCADLSYDFVLSSHCIEHLANPIGGLLEWQRVLKVGGALLLIVPHKDGTFDHRRPVTALSHLLDDFNAEMPESDLTHLDEVLRLHDTRKDAGSPEFAAFKIRCEDNFAQRCIHHHVFNTQLAVEVVDQVGFQVINVQLLRPFHIVILAEKLAAGAIKNNVAFLGQRARPVWTSPFASDQRNYW